MGADPITLSSGVVVNRGCEVALLARTLIHLRCDRSNMFRSETARAMLFESFPGANCRIIHGTSKVRIRASVLRLVCGRGRFSSRKLDVRVGKGLDTCRDV